MGVSMLAAGPARAGGRPILGPRDGGLPSGPVLADFTAVERLLLDAARRAVVPGWVALILRFSAFPPPGPRTYHLSVARSLLEDAVHRHGGQVFAMRNGDLVLLAGTAVLTAPLPAHGGAAPGETLPDLLLRLFRADCAAPERLIGILTLPDARERLLTYASERLGDIGGTATGDQPRMPIADSRSLTSVAPGPLPDLLHRQTAVLIGSEGARLRPLFREVMSTNAALEAEAGDTPIEPDPFLLHHYAARLERRVAAALPTEIGRSGALDPALAPPLHVNISPAGINSDAFLELAAITHAAGLLLGAEIPLTDAVADPAGLELARARLAREDIAYVIDEVSHLALTMTELGALGASLYKLAWSPRIETLAGAERQALDGAIHALGAGRLAVTGADSEAALHWGLARGIRRFQGRHVDAMLAAARLTVCPAAAACTLRQCQERASAVAPAGRHGCANTALLDAGMPTGAP